MTSIEDQFTEIGSLLAKKEGKRPEEKLEALMRQMAPRDLDEWRPEVKRLIDKFRPKRRRNLLTVLASRAPDDAVQAQGAKTVSVAREAAGSYAVAIDAKLLAEFRGALEELRERHIFQWSTFYRDCLARYLDRFLEEMKRRPRDDSGDVLARPFAEHAGDVFSQGYAFAISKGHGHDDAIRKSLNGLARFLALPLDFYSARASDSSPAESIFALRLLTSAAVRGILEGYATAQFGNKMGGPLLPRFQRQWLHYMAFLTPGHADRVIDLLEPGPLVDGLQASVLPLLDAFQCFHERGRGDYVPVPVAGQYSWYQRRLDVSLRPPQDAVSQRLLVASAFLEEGFVSIADLDEAVRRQTRLVIAPLKPDVKSIVRGREDLAAIVVAPEVDGEAQGARVPADRPRTQAAKDAFRVWERAVFDLRSRFQRSTPIAYNFARDFPLHDPSKETFFRIPRTSVRDLLRTFERRPGVRLWCSVRRSGKTTACFDLESTTGDSVIVSQTCGVNESDDATALYEGVREAVASGRMVPKTFIADVVSQCATHYDESKRTVLVIDEYETLFGLLRNAVEEDPRKRHPVVQPILNQLMKFSYDNLLVFLGQQPDAHFILMDQNQLAPYVKQDPFPLFEHVRGTRTGEFSELVRRILMERIECAPGFMDALYDETAGHPYLTANVLGEFVEWLIEKRRPQLGLRVDGADFASFAGDKLTAAGIMLSPDYDFFRQAAADAMSERGYRANPWLFTAYWVLRLLSKRESDRFHVESAGFPELMRGIPVPEGGCLPERHEVLRSASQANFLSYDEDRVRVRIRTLGRIASAVQPGLA